MMLSNNSTKLWEISKDILSEISDWVWEVNKLGFFTYYSEGLKEFLGLNAREMSEVNLFDMFPNLQLENLKQLTEFKDYIKSKNKGIFEIVLCAKPFFDEVRSFMGFRGTFKILNKTKYLPLLIGKYDDIVMIINENLTIEKVVKFNKKSQFELEEKEIRNTSFLELLPPEEGEALKEFFHGLKKNHENSIESRLIQGNGAYLWCDIRGSLYKGDDNDIKYLLFMRNIKKTKQKELSLEETIERYRTFLLKSTQTAFSMELNLKYTYIAIPLKKILGYEPGELKKKVPKELMTLNSRNKLEGVMKKELEEEVNPHNLLKKIIIIDLEFIRKDGTIVPMESFISFFGDKQNKIQGIVGNVSKFIFYEDLEKKLIDSEERYRNLFETSPNAIVLFDTKGVIQGLNSTAKKISGYKSSDLVGKKFQDLKLFPKEFYPIIMKDFINLLKGKSTKINEIQLYKKDLTTNWVLYQGALLKLRDENIIQVIIQDIHDYKLIERKLRSSEKLYRNLFDNSPFGVWLVNSEGIIVDCNKGFNLYISDIPKDEIIGKPFVNTLTKIRGADYVRPPIIQTSKNIKDYCCLDQVEFQATGINNKKIWITIENTIINIDRKIFFQVIIRNISDTKEAELKLQQFNKDLESQIEERTGELKQSEGRLILKNEEQTLLLDNIDTQIWYLKDEKTYGAVNKAHATFLGVNQGLFENKELDSILSSEDFKVSLASNIDVFKTKKQVRAEEFMNDKTGSRRLLSITKTPKLNEKGDVRFVVCAAEDITDRHKTQVRLKESESRFRTMTEQSLMGIIILQDGFVKYANHAMTEITEYSIDELVSLKKFEIKKIFHPDDFLFLTNSLVEVTRHQLLKKEEEIPAIQISFRILTKSGKLKWIIAYAKQIKFQEKNAILTSMVDITEKKKFEVNLIESERKLREKNIELMKLDELKTDFITIAAHELKTPLISIIGFVDLILTRNKDLSGEIKEDMERVMGNAMRLQNYIEQLMDVLIIDAKKIHLNKKQIIINDIITECVSELEFQINKKNITIDIQVKEDISICVDEIRLMQIFSNLISNAIKFSKNEGKVRIVVKDRGNNILCTIQDYGLGLSKKEISLLFKKFETINQDIETFSTLERGSGLGLYIARGLVEAHGGKIWANSMGKNLGAEFSFTLPK